METIKIKYLIGTINSGLICLFSFQHNEKYSIVIPIIFLILCVASLYLLCFDQYSHKVTDDNGKLIAKFDNEKEAMKFANDQAKNVRVLMMHIQ